MNKTELISKLKYGKIAVHCKTNKEAKEFLKMCDESCNNYDKEYCEKYCEDRGLEVIEWSDISNKLDDKIDTPIRGKRAEMKIIDEKADLF